MQTDDTDSIEVLIVGKDNPHSYLTLVEKLGHAIKAPEEVLPPKLVARIARELPHLVEVYAEDLVPALIFFDVPSLQKEPDEARNIQNYIHGIKVLDPSCFIIGLAEKLPPREEVMRWMKVGIMAWLKTDFEAHELEDSLKDAFSKRIDMVPRRLRVKVDHQIEVKIANLEQASASEVIDLGVGGMFIRTAPRGIKAGDKIEFLLKTRDKLGENSLGGHQGSNPIDEELPIASAEDMHGTALVVWVRSQANALGPEGIGVQFLTVDARTHRFFESAILQRKIRIFIPKE